MQPEGEHPSDARDEPALPTETVGATLRAARARLGSGLAEVAAVLRIRSTFLQAIEDGDFQALPGAPYAMGFVRTYAEHLGLDGAEMVRRFKSEAAGLERKTSLSFPSPAPEGRVPGTAALLISLVAVTVLVAGWYFYQSAGERPAQLIPEVPERLANPSSQPAPAFNMGGLGDTPSTVSAASSGPAPANPAVPPAPATDALPGPGGPASVAMSPAATGTLPTVSSAGGPAAAPGGALPGMAPAASTNEPALPPPPGDPTRRLAALPAPVIVPPPPAAGSTAPAEAEDGPPPEPTALGAPQAGSTAEPAIPPVPQVAAVPADGRVFGAQNGDARVVIRARGESWVQIRDATNTSLLTRVLRPGDSYRVPNKAGLVMMTGNAGVLDVFVDGNPAPALGAVGAVRRNIALDADRLRAGAAGTE